MQKKLKILQVEDNADDAFLIQRNLRKYGFEIETKRVENSADLQHALATEEWDIVLSDYSMPNFDGLSALEITNKYPHIPYILVSGAVGDEAAVEIMKNGAKDFIFKDKLGRLGPAIKRELAEIEVHKDKEASERIIQALMKGLASATGHDAFENIIKGVGEWLNCEIGLIALVDPDSEELNIFSCFIDGHKCENISPFFSVDVSSKILEEGLLVVSGNAAELFPSDNFFIDQKIESFIGMPLFKNEGRKKGIICFLSKHEVTPPERLPLVFDIVAAKASSEIERIFAENERLRLEDHLQRSQKMEAIGTMAGGIAHDFNNILTGIIGYSELARNDLDGMPEVKDKISKVLQAGHRAKELVQQILTFSRHHDDEKQPLEVIHIVKEALKLLRASIPSTIEFDEDINAQQSMVKAVPSQIHQIIMNLCTNAYHAMEKTGGVLSISLRNVEVDEQQALTNSVAPGKYICLKVSDTGVGIPAEILGRIFEPYFTTKDKGVGTGLGLSLVHGIVKGHGGYITVSSEENKGCSFSVFLPVSTCVSIENNADKDEESLLTGTERILVADDEGIIVSFLKDILNGVGYEVTSACDGAQALDIFTKSPESIDLLLTDMTMPKMTGIELSKKCLAIRPDLPIILCTGYNDLATRDTVLGCGVSEYLMKPISAVKLCQIIRKLLDKK